MPKARILSFNTLYAKEPRPRLRALAEILEASDYDIVCLQELWIPPNFELLRSLTPSYRYAAHGPRLPLVIGGLLTLSRVPIVGHKFWRYGVRRPLRRDLLTRKGVLTTRFAIDGEFLTVANTHLSANMYADWSRSQPFTRVQQAELGELSGVLRRFDAGDPLVAVGDFNVPRESWLFEEFVASSGLTDLFDGDPSTTYRPVPPRPPRPGWPGASLDQALVSPGLEARAKLVLQDAVPLAGGRSAFLSDHYGVAVEIV